VALPAATPDTDRQHPRQLSFYPSDTVPGGAPADLGAQDDEGAGGLPVPSDPRIADPTGSTTSAGVDTGWESTNQSSSLGDRQAAIRNGLRWTMVGRPVIEAANLLGVAVLARLVVPVEFGRYAIALIVLTLASIPTQAVQYAIVQRADIDRDHLRTGQTLTVLMGLAVCAFCFAASYTVVPILFGARTAVLVRLMTPACFINSVNTVQLAIITRRLEFRRLTLLDMTITVVGTAASIALAAIGLNAEAMVIGVIAASAAGFILTCCWILPPIPHFRLRSARDLLHSGIPAASAAASLVGFQNCDYVIIGARLGQLQAGYYFRAYSLSVVYQKKVTQVLTSVGFPVLSRATSEKEIDHLRQRMVHTITLVLFPLLTALTIVAPRFVTWFYGPAWRAAVVPVQILAIGGGAMLVVEAVTVAMLATGRARAVSWWGWGHFLVYGTAVFAVSRFGLIAIAIAAAAVHTIFLIISYVLLHHGRLRDAFKTLATDVLPAAASSVGLAAVALPVSVLASTLGIPMLPYLLFVAVAGGAGYFLSLRLWFATELRHLGVLAGRVLPARIHRLGGRFIVRPQP
jgi:lipopolysaccharide exporter